MGMKLITGPAIEPVTLAEAKTQLGITDSVQDDLITRYIQAAREYAEDYTHKAIISQTWELALDRFPVEIELPKMPVQSITSVKYLDEDGVEQTISSADYGLDNYSPRHWLLLAADTEWPNTYETANAVKIRFVAGFGSSTADVPEKIRTAIILTVGHWINFKNLAEQGVTVQMVPRAVDHLLRPYKDIRI